MTETFIYKYNQPSANEVIIIPTKKTPRIDYFVEDGPDTRHLVKIKRFNRLKDANTYVKRLSARRAYKLVRLESPHGFSTASTKSKVLKQRII